MATDSKPSADLDGKFSELLALTPEDRLQLAERLIASVSDFDNSREDDEWSKEIARRIEEHESGRDPGIPAEQVFAELEERLQRKYERESRQ